MAQSAEHGKCNDLSQLAGLHHPRYWAVLLQAQMRPRVVVVVEVLPEHPPQVASAEHDDVVQALAAEGADDPFRETALPRGVWRNANLSQAGGLDAPGNTSPYL